MAESAAMGRKAIELGPTAKTVAENAQRFRMMRGLTLSALSDRVTALGRPMSANTLSTIELMQRRADVDDLLALAAALNVSPAALLMPHIEPEDGNDAPEDAYPETSADRPMVTATDSDTGETVVTEVPSHTAGQLWSWLVAESPLDAPYLDDEPDTVAIEMWRREQVPSWAYRAKTGGAGRD